MELHDIADELVSNLSQKQVIEQLKGLGVAAIFLEKLPDELRGHLCPGVTYTDDDLWRLNWIRNDNLHSISLNKDDDIPTWFYTVGHEVGHILCDKEPQDRILRAYVQKYNIGIPDGVDMETPKEIFRKFWEAERGSEELFCEIFSSLWVNYGRNKSELSDIISTISLTNHKIIL